MSNFEKVLEFNKAFGVVTNTKPHVKIFDEDKKLLEYRLSLIIEEVKELQDAIREKDFTETIDALADILYVTLGAFTAIGIHADQAFKIVHDSNMSKLCPDEATAIRTVEFYKKNESDRYPDPIYRLADDKKNWVVLNESTMKILKNIDYIPADFSKLIQ